MPPPNPLSARLRIQLKLSISRLRHIQQKESALAKQQRRDIAQLLSNEKDESARIRIENIIRQEINVELLEILELYCELLLARIGLLEQRRECDPGLEEPVKSIIYAAGRTDVKELLQVRDVLIAKFGKEFARDALENPATSVAPRVYKKLTIEPPSTELVTAYLEEIARTYRIPWSGLPEAERKSFADEGDDDGEGGGGIGVMDTGLQLPSVGGLPEKVPVPPISVAPAAASTENPRPGVTFQGQNIKPATAPTSAKKSDIPDFDELSRRFAALKR
ncbi:regulator of Vps4 activity in the MVB pathway-domain-containing protein [Lipomyces chichibuensis]|uniref:regulator of Vps4 activity in the MVB pathway-domain-containing protein n=1 Tax=Lipomyces chichibuensis TaxID=1546026 RepID=UPI003343814D